MSECPKCGCMLVHDIASTVCSSGNCDYRIDRSQLREGVTNIGQMEMNSRPNGSPLNHSTHILVSGNSVWPGRDSIVLVSGGMDSVTLAYYVAKYLRKNPVIMFFDYGQKTIKRELVYAMNCATELVVPFTTIDITGNFVKSAIIKGSEDSMVTKDTVVPGRNMLFISFAVAMAASNGLEEVYIGVQIGDDEGYPDCRPQFWGKMYAAAMLGYNVRIKTPFLSLNKKDIVDLGKRLGVDYGDTYSCYYNDDGNPCGKCPSCKVRMEAGLNE